MTNLIEKYNQFILNLKPSKTWLVTRFILHWVTIPIKLVAIGGLGLYQILAKLTYKARPVPKKSSLLTRSIYFNKVLNALPVYKNIDEQLYVNRVPLYAGPDGTNHNTDHQASRHGTYVYCMTELGLRNEAMEKSLADHIYNGNLVRGYKKHFLDGDNVYNEDNVSGDMLCGMTLAMLGAQSDLLKNRFRLLVENIVEKNDYALLEAGGQKKSDRGMWQPGLETVGAQALTLLAALRVADKVCGSEIAKKAYNKMLLVYGYGVLSLFPTAYIDKQRGYFNDHNSLMCLYVLSKLSSKPGKLFWKLPMLYVWSLSKHWYNGYFTGLVRKCYPKSISQEYVDKCQAYLNEDEPRTWLADVIGVETNEAPVKYNDQYEDEFFPDTRLTLKWPQFDPKLRCWGGLGFLATAVALENNPKDLL